MKRPAETTPMTDLLGRKLLFVNGKGGVGKTAVSQAIALSLSRQGSRTLWVAFEDPTRPPGELIHRSPTLAHLNCESSTAFEEYMGLKIGAPALTRLFLQNKVVRYLSKAAPGIHELVLLGKVWHETQNYEHVVVDMPSTGYGLAMFQSTANFHELFSGGPIHTDSEKMLATFRDPATTGNLIVALPEEMPLVESLDLARMLEGLLPGNAPGYLVNRRFPHVGTARGAHSAIPPSVSGDPDSWTTPVPRSAADYAVKRSALEEHNLRLWREPGLSFGELPYLPPSLTSESLPAALAGEMERRGYL
jgi:hypothetical protein